MERETKITNTKGEEFTVFENPLGETKLAPMLRFERVLEADLENPQGEGRGYPLTPDELLARDE